MSTIEHDLVMKLQYRETPVDDSIVQNNRKMMLDVFDRIMAGDFDALWSVFADDAVLHEAPSFPYGGTFRGLAEVKRAFGYLSTFYSKMNAVVEAIVAGEDMVVVYETVKYTVKANGNSGSFHVSEMFRFRNGKVVEWRAFYFDAHALLQALTVPATSA